MAAQAVRYLLCGFAGTSAMVAVAQADPLPKPRPEAVPFVVELATRTPAPPPNSALPQPLSATDAKHYRRIFAAQDRGDWQLADRAISRLGSRQLLGHVLFQRYMHPTAYRADYAELASWLRLYADHPGAYRVYSLAKRRQPKGGRPLKVPTFGQEHLRHFLGEGKPGTVSQKQRHRHIAQEIRSRIARSHLSVAERMISASGLPAEQADRLRGQVALGWLAFGNPRKAFRLARQAAKRSRNRTSVPDWVAGLAAYRLGDYGSAAKHFGLHAKSQHAGEWNVSAGAFWAARAEANRGRTAKARDWLRQATAHPYTFYGQLALGRLGEPTPEPAETTRFDASDLARIQALSGGKRVLALVQVGQVQLADSELLQHLSKAPPELARSITSLAAIAGLPQSAIRGGYRMARTGDTPGAEALYPLPEWKPRGGFSVDRALIWAFVRQESVFNPRATSGAGARGLMQLMPSTANYVAGDDRFEGRRRDALYDPSLNLSLGQRYLRYLMQKPYVGRDLFRLAVAYNAGVGNLVTWKREDLLANDPLFFIETLPLLETRLFVERVVANYWVYRGLMGQPRPSLQAVLQGQWPRYAAQDDGLVEIAEDFSYAN